MNTEETTIKEEEICTEHFVIGCIFLQRKPYQAVLDKIDHTFFRLKKCRALFKVIEEYRQETKHESIDASVLASFCEQKGYGREYYHLAADCSDKVDSSQYIDYYVNKLIDKKAHQEKTNLHSQFLALKERDDDKESELFKQFDEITRKYSSYKIPIPDPQAMWDSFKKSGTAIGIGIQGIDFIPNRTGGITVVGARTSEGKTTFMMNSMIGLFIKNPKKRFIFYSFEEKDGFILAKLLIILLAKKCPNHPIFKLNMC